MPAVASAQTPETSDHRGVWKYFLSAWNSLLRPDDIDLHSEPACDGLPRRLYGLRESVLLSRRRYLQRVGVLRCAVSRCLRRLLLRAGKCVRAGELHRSLPGGCPGCLWQSARVLRDRQRLRSKRLRPVTRWTSHSPARNVQRDDLYLWHG